MNRCDRQYNCQVAGNDRNGLRQGSGGVYRFAAVVATSLVVCQKHNACSKIQIWATQ